MEEAKRMCIQSQLIAGFLLPICQSHQTRHYITCAGHRLLGEGKQALSSVVSSLQLRRNPSRQPKTGVSVNVLREAGNPFNAQTHFLAVLCCLPPTVGSQEGLLQDSMVAQDWDNPKGPTGSMRMGRRATSSCFTSETTVTKSLDLQALLLSSGIAFDVLVHFVPKILLVSQMMFCSFNIQGIVKIQKISK